MSDVKESVGNAVKEVVTGVLTGKKWYESKTFWGNVIMAAAVAVQAKTGFMVSPEVQALVISGVNLVLRAVTKDPIVW